MTSEHQGHDDGVQSGPMQTLLSHFCRALETRLSPLLEPIRDLAGGLATEPTRVPEVLPQLREVADQVTLLVDKMAEQQAYVLIFGPLKSGKSTLMNAICAKYVSEVTCLPAYPCMVHVSHAERTRYQLTRYDGTTEMLDDPERLTRAVASDHEALVEAIRRSEAEGVDFEPQEHAADAIRRIDVRVPAGDLAQSGAVLVDTPGLYTRMKFGYDRMTREFRNAAACAIFVVKTDNLFLDQVFQEFEDLLEMFGRIFLVVNLDSTKQDLQPDGTLSPSLEHANPQAVVAAFENLAMSAALREAREDGRLQIYPVDLLRAASQRIQAEAPGHDGEIEGDHEALTDFSFLLEDLTEYLNSNEYLRAFVGDSVRRAQGLLEELHGLLHHERIEALESRQETLTDRQRELHGSTAALDRLKDVAWQEPAMAEDAALRERLVEQLDQTRTAVRESLTAGLDAWFANDASLGDFCREQLSPALADVREDVLRLLSEEFERHLGPAAASSALTDATRTDLALAGVDFQAEVRAVLDELPIAEGVSRPEGTLDSMRVPVRRSLLDWLLLRSRGSVRRRLFGSLEQPDVPLAAADKQRRLGERGRAAMLDQMEALVGPMITPAEGALLDSLLERYRTELASHLEGRCEQLREAAVEEAERVAGELAELGRLVVRIEGLREQTDDTRTAVTRVAAELAEVEAGALKQPVDERLYALQE